MGQISGNEQQREMEFKTRENSIGAMAVDAPHESLLLSMWLRLLVGLLPFGFTSCIIGGLAPTTRHVPFSEQDFAGYDRAGSGSIRGQVSADYQGNHYISQGEQVALMPITPYTSEMVTRELANLTKEPAAVKA